MILAPSVSFALSYILAYIWNVVWLSAMWGTLESENFVDMLTQTIVIAFSGIGLFYIL